MKVTCDKCKTEHTLSDHYSHKCPDICSDCGHLCVEHQNDTGTNLPGCNMLIRPETKCPCTRTYESLLGENMKKEFTPQQKAEALKIRAEVEAKYRGFGHLPDNIPRMTLQTEPMETELPLTCDVGDVFSLNNRLWRCNTVNEWTELVPKSEEKMETELQLLVIDLGDGCVVKVEKGHFHLPIPESDLDYHGYEGEVLVTKLPFTELREAIEQKPVPRIELRKDKSYATGNNVYLLFATKDSTGDGIEQVAYNALSELAGKPLPVWKGGTWEEAGHIDDHVYNNTDLRVWRYKL